MVERKSGTRPAGEGDLDELPGGPLLPDELTHFLGYLLRRAFVRVSADSARDDINSRDISVLEALAQGARLSQLDLAEELGINRTIMVSVIDRLEERGYVARTRNPENRRSYVLSITESGRNELERSRTVFIERDKQLTVPLDSAERARLNELLAELVSARSEPTGMGTEMLLGRAHNRIRKLGDDMLADTDLRIRHYAPLVGLASIAPCAQQELAAYLAIAEPAAAQLVDDLVRADLVRRGRDTRDRRRYALELTSMGQQQLQVVQKVVNEIQTTASDALGATGEAELRALLLKLLRAEKTK